jgi:hypothetical protein
MNEKVKINFRIMRTAVKAYAKEKAKNARSSVIYLQDKKIIEENLQTSTKTVILSGVDY